jgi:hypothetical protein
VKSLPVLEALNQQLLKVQVPDRRSLRAFMTRFVDRCQNTLITSSPRSLRFKAERFSES